MDKPKFEFYVLNYDFNKQKVIMFNIFDNIDVYDLTLKEVKKYCRSPKKYTFCIIFSLIYIVLNVILRIVYMAIRTDLYADYIYFNNTMFVLSVFGMLLSYAPFVMFMVYIFACYSKNRNHILLTIAYILNILLRNT